jgi:NAD(P)H-dependent FMN reductase
MANKLKVILGSVRASRFSEKVAPWAMQEIAKHPEFEAELLDLRDYEMPFFNEASSPSSKKEPYKNEVVARWTAKIAEGDAFLFVLPEYDRSVPGVLKNAIDWVYPEWNNKPLSILSYGTMGGARSAEHLRSMGIEMQMAPIRQAVQIPLPWTLQDENGNIKPGALDSYTRSMDTMLKQLSWWTEVLKYGREKVAAK